MTLGTAAHQTSLSSAISWSLLKIMSIESVILSNHLILCHPLLLPSVFPSIRVFSNESALHNRWPKYWSFSFSISVVVGGRKISETAVGERDSQGKHGKEFGRWMAVEKEGRKKSAYLQSWWFQSRFCQYWDVCGWTEASGWRIPLSRGLLSQLHCWVILSHHYKED